MRQTMYWLICFSLTIALTGCDSGGKPPAKKDDKAAAANPTSSATASVDGQQGAADTSKLVLVSLNVPNMT
jgi:hypothetical protein